MKENISVTIDEAVLLEIDKMAADDGRTRSNMIEKILKENIEEKNKNNQD